MIDDVPSIVRGLTWLLRREGYHVETARNGRHALAHLQRQGFDVILTDLCMPELDGRALYAVLQQPYPALCQRVIFLTAASDEADTRAFLAQSGQPWLSKPYAHPALRSAMQQVLARAAPALPAAGWQTRSQQLRGRSQALRWKSQALSDKVSALCLRSGQLRVRAASCRAAAGQPMAGKLPPAYCLPHARV